MNEGGVGISNIQNHLCIYVTQCVYGDLDRQDFVQDPGGKGAKKWRFPSSATELNTSSGTSYRRSRLCDTSRVGIIAQY